MMMSTDLIDKVSKSCNIDPMDTQSTQRFEEAARLLKILGHPVRLAMVETLWEKQWCVCELASHLGLNKSAASKHLSLLNNAGVIAMEKEGTRVNCTLVMPCIFDMMLCANHFKPLSEQKSEGTTSCGGGCCSTKEESPK
jgi:ArsR family transcriptional regulator